MDILMSCWKFFAQNILTQPAYFIGLIVAIGYILLKKKWYDVIAGFIKAVIGYQILLVGSGGLVTSFRPVLVGLEERFNLSAMVIDPYFGQNAVQSGMADPNGPAFIAGRSFSSVMFLLLFAFILNILLVAFKKQTKLRAIFTTGHVQVQQAATAHQQMFGVYCASKASEWLAKHTKKESKRIEDIELPGFLKIFNENLVATAILMTLFFGIILLILGPEFLSGANKAGTKFFDPSKQSFVFYIMTTAFQFAVYLSILQLGVRTFVTELTNSFRGISNKLLKGSVPGVDCAVTYGFGSPNAVTLGFLMGAAGQFLAIALLLLLKSPVVVIAGFVPLFFDNATIGVYANNKGGLRAVLIMPFISGLLQVFGSALIAGWVGMAAYGGYLGMWDWAVVWPIMTGVMKYLSYAGLVIVAIALIAIPQLQYRAHKDTYFMEVEDYQKCKEIRAKQAAEKNGSNI